MQIDSISGLNQDKDICEFVFKTAQKSNNGIIIECDFFNLGNLNEAIGRDQANRFYNTYVKVLIAYLQRLDPQYVYGFRKASGDEFSLILEHPEIGTVNEALKLANLEIQTLCQRTSLSKLSHSKRPNNAGFGIHFYAEKIFEEDRYAPKAEAGQNRITQLKRDDGVNVANAKHDPEFFKSKSKIALIDASLKELSRKHKDAVISTTLSTRFTSAASYIPDREKRTKKLDTLATSTQATIVRFDLMNMARLNETLGKDFTDLVLEEIKNIIYETFEQSDLNYELYDIGGGIYDVIIDSDDQIKTNNLNRTIMRRANSTIFNTQHGSYAPIFDINNGLDTNTKTGLVIASQAADKGTNKTLERLDEQVDLLKLHGLSFIEPHNKSLLQKTLTSVKAIFSSISNSLDEEESPQKFYSIYPLATSRPTEIIDQDSDIDGSIPHAKSLRERLSAEQLETLIYKGTEPFCKMLFGYLPDLNPKPRLYYRFFQLDVVSRTLNGLRLLEKHNQSNSSAEDFINHEESLQYLLQDTNVTPLLEEHHNRRGHTRVISALINVCVHAANITEQPVSQRFIDMVSASTDSEIRYIAQSFLERDPIAANKINELADTIKSDLTGNLDYEGVEFILYRELERQRILVSKSDRISEEQKQTILSNMSLEKREEVPRPNSEFDRQYSREYLEMLAERHKFWLETSGQEGTRLELSNVRMAGVAMMLGSTRETRGNNPDLMYDFRNAEITDSRLTKMDWGGATFKGATLRNVDFDCGLMDGTDFRGVKQLKACHLAFSDLRGAKFELSPDLLTCRFHDRDMYENDFALYKQVEFYMPDDGPRVYGFYPIKESRLHFQPTPEDIALNKKNGISPNEIREAIGNSKPNEAHNKPMGTTPARF